MKYHIAIPTYNRVDSLINTTLKMLDNYDISFNLIDIFVENQYQYDLYSDHIDNIKIIITNTTGIGQKHNFIRKYYKNLKMNFISIDDDVSEIKNMSGQLHNLKLFIGLAFEALNMNDMTLFGCSTYNNAFYKADKLTKHLKKINGVFFGVLYKENKPLIQTDFNMHSDLDFCIQYFLEDKGVLVFNNISVVTEYLGPGGIQSHQSLEERKQKEKEELELLNEMYPELLKILPNNKFKLNWKYKI